MYKISIIVCIVLMIFFVGMMMWEDNKDKQLEESAANLLFVKRWDVEFRANKQRLATIEMTKIEEGEILILAYKEAIELKHEPSIGAYAYVVKDFPWPVRPSLFAGKFIEWLYLNDYAIVKKEVK